MKAVNPSTTSRVLAALGTAGALVLMSFSFAPQTVVPSHSSFFIEVKEQWEAFENQFVGMMPQPHRADFSR